jgi:hypothetical protein
MINVTLQAACWLTLQDGKVSCAFSVKTDDPRLMKEMRSGEEKFTELGCESFLHTTAGGIAAAIRYIEEQGYGTKEGILNQLLRSIEEHLKGNEVGGCIVVLDPAAKPSEN